MQSTINESDLEFGDRISFGATSEVYRARWKSHHTDVAAKKIPIHSNSEISEQLRLEVDIMKHMNHRNVIKYYGHVLTPTHVIIITEYAAKGSLKDYLKTVKSLPPKQLQKWAIQAARGVQYLKNSRIVHRDIKSPNFLIMSDDTLKVCDFGISRHLDVTQSTESDKGTAYWMAPEVYVNGELSPKSDIYSLGIVLWELCSCELPYKGMLQHNVMFKVGSEGYRPEIPADCPLHLGQLIRECWHQDRRKRPGIDEVVSRLERFAEVDEGEDVQVEPFVAVGGPGSPGTAYMKHQGPTPMDTTNVGISPFDSIDGRGVGITPMDATDALGVRGSPITDATGDGGGLPASISCPTGAFPVQETKEPPFSSHFMSEASPPAPSTVQLSGPTFNARPQFTEENVWNEVADLAMSNLDKRRVIQKILSSATEVMSMHLHVDPMLLTLKSKQALDDGDVSDIKSQVRNDYKVDRLLEILKHKDDSAYETFLAVLKGADMDLYKEVREIEKRLVREWRTNSVKRQGTQSMFQDSEPYKPYEDEIKISDHDLFKVSKELTHDQLKKLYLSLGLQLAAVEKAERKANTNDEDLKAIEVLRLWRQMNGRKATREEIIRALKMCDNMEAVVKFEKLWNFDG